MPVPKFHAARPRTLVEVVIGETEKAAKEVQVNLRKPYRILADNDGYVITSVITDSS
jgi:hypothetical protein